jgi:enolase
MYKLKEIKARQIFDSRGVPTIECKVKTPFGIFVESVPSGASTGEREAVELRDNEKEFFGRGVRKAVRNINEVFSVALKDKDVRNQEEIDNILIKEDGTDNKGKYGANAILASSLAIARAGGVANGKKELWEYINQISKREAILPVPVLNIINGGKHAGNDLDFQEYQIIPIKFKSFKEAFNAGVEVYHQLKINLEKDFGKGAINIGDEGGFAPNLSKVEEPIDQILKAVETLGYGNEFGIGIDVAASSFSKLQDDGKITYQVEGKTLTNEQLLNEYKALLETYPIVSIEDPFDENDYDSWSKMYSELNKRVQIVGDDLTVSQYKFVKEAIDKKYMNALLLKVNQVGSVTEAINSAMLAFDNNLKVQVSHRSGETNSSFIADFAVGLGATQIKSGAPARGERLAKYNRLLSIEENSSLKFASKDAFPRFK